MASSFNMSSVSARIRAADSSEGDVFSYIGRAISSVARRFGSRNTTRVENVAALLPPADGLKQQASRHMASYGADVEGGFARVWLVKRDLGAYAIKAAKKVTPHTPSKESMQRELYCEARALQSLKHPNIVELLGAWQDPDQGVVLVQGLMSGSLIELSKAEEISIHLTCQVGCDVSAGLGYMHEQGFVHGDFQEGNVLYSRTQGGVFHFQVSDFGRCVKKGKRSAGSGNAYMPPEVSSYWRRDFPGHFVSSPTAHPANDVWAFGAMIIYMLTYLDHERQAQWLCRLGKISTGAVSETEVGCLKRLGNIALSKQKTIKCNDIPDLESWVTGMLGATSGCQSIRLERRPPMNEIHKRFQEIATQK